MKSPHNNKNKKIDLIANKERNKNIFLMRESGMTYPAIAKIVNLNPQYIRLVYEHEKVKIKKLIEKLNQMGLPHEA